MTKLDVKLDKNDLIDSAVNAASYNHMDVKGRRYVTEKDARKIAESTSDISEEIAVVESTKYVSRVGLYYMVCGAIYLAIANRDVIKEKFGDFKDELKNKFKKN